MSSKPVQVSLSSVLLSNSSFAVVVRRLRSFVVLRSELSSSSFVVVVVRCRRSSFVVRRSSFVVRRSLFVVRRSNNDTFIDSHSTPTLMYPLMGIK